jgi:hypothetical protein
MPPLEPNAQQLRAKAFALIAIAAVTSAMVVYGQLEQSDRLLAVPIIASYLLFNFGFVWFSLRMRPHTKGTRQGALAVALNLTAMFLGKLEVIWTILSIAAVLLALIASYTLFNEAKAVGA